MGRFGRSKNRVQGELDKYLDKEKTAHGHNSVMHLQGGASSGNKGYGLLHGSSNLEKKLLAREETSTNGELYVRTYIGTSRVTPA
jgi:hypothetical protein